MLTHVTVQQTISGSQNPGTWFPVHSVTMCKMDPTSSIPEQARDTTFLDTLTATPATWYTLLNVCVASATWAKPHNVLKTEFHNISTLLEATR